MVVILGRGSIEEEQVHTSGTQLCEDAGVRRSEGPGVEDSFGISFILHPSRNTSPRLSPVLIIITKNPGEHWGGKRSISANPDIYKQCLLEHKSADDSI
jgi:hypothetical protein